MIVLIFSLEVVILLLCILLLIRSINHDKRITVLKKDLKITAKRVEMMYSAYEDEEDEQYHGDYLDIP